MSLNPKMRQQLKAYAHKLKPIVIVGSKGLTENVHTEIDRALTDHQLIKIRINSNDREERQELLNEIISVSRAEKVQMVGSVCTIYRENPADD